jgi:ribonuclease P protein component
LTTVIRYTLGRAGRLKSRKQIDLLFKKGQSFSIFPFRVIWMFEETGKNTLQAAFSVSTKTFRRAVDRNRIKRLMREAWRLQKNVLQQHLKETGKHIAVFLIYKGNELPEHAFVSEKIGVALNRLIKLCNEKDTAHT